MPLLILYLALLVRIDYNTHPDPGRPWSLQARLATVAWATVAATDGFLVLNQPLLAPWTDPEKPLPVPQA
jgi:hypothetical protein